MANRPVIFISATSDLRSARDLVGKVLYSMGYEPVWQDIEPTDGGELLEVLRRRIAPCATMVQLIGQRYGAEPPQPTAEFGRVSYTQFEALEAERVGKKVIYLLLDESYPTEPAAAGSPEEAALQTAYRQRLIDANRLRHGGIASASDLKLSIRRLSDDLAALRREVTGLPVALSRMEAPRVQINDETQPPLSAEIDNPPSPVDETVQFTVYRPRAVRPARWETMLAFAHLSERRPGEEDQPHPLEELERQAQAALGTQREAYDSRTQDSSGGVPRGGLITFVPEIAGVEFNPTHRSFKWIESVHREEFRLLATNAANQEILRGKMSVFLGALLLADIALTLRVESSRTAAAPTQPERARPYRRIFASYSHKDVAIVEQFEAYLNLVGDEVLRDWKHLKAGEIWDDRLCELIREADVFQLFWSSNSLGSSNVRREWEFALSLGRDHFVRPMYWQTPMPTAAGLPPEELKRLHFTRLAFGMPAEANADKSGDQIEGDRAPGEDFDCDYAPCDALEADAGPAAAVIPKGATARPGKSHAPARRAAFGVGLAAIGLGLLASLALFEGASQTRFNPGAMPPPSSDRAPAPPDRTDHRVKKSEDLKKAMERMPLKMPVPTPSSGERPQSPGPPPLGKPADR